MDSWGTILTGYSIVFGVVGIYAISLIRRGHALGRRLGLPESEAPSELTDDPVNHPNREDVDGRP